jgi:hypothetical protein
MIRFKFRPLTHQGKDSVVAFEEEVERHNERCREEEDF